MIGDSYKLCGTFCYNREDVLLSDRVSINAAVQSINICFVRNAIFIDFYNAGGLTRLEPHFII